MSEPASSKRGAQSTEEVRFVLLIGERLHRRYGRGEDWQYMGGKRKDSWYGDAIGLLDTLRDNGVRIAENQLPGSLVKVGEK